MNKNMLVVVVLVVLVVIAAVQAVQLNTLKDKVSGASSISTPTVSSGGGSGQAADLPTSLQNLPTMVGGC